MNKPVLLAVVGAGLIGRRHADYIARSDDANLVAIVDPQKSRRSVAKLHDVRFYTRVGELLDNAKPDGVIVASPNHAHLENALECIDRGIPVLVEKPIADTVAAARKLVDGANAAKVAVLVGHHRRHNPLIQAARQHIRQGNIGKLLAVNGMCWLYKPDDYFDAGPWRTKTGAGPVYINLIHDIDLLRYLCGNVVSVSAVESSKTRGFEVEDTAAVLLEFESGVLGTLSVSDTIAAPWSWEMTAGENAAYYKTEESCYVLGGTNGSLCIPDLHQWQNADKPGWMQPILKSTLDVHHADPLALQITHFAKVIHGVEPPLVSGQEGLATLRVIEAIKQSAGSGRRMVL